MSITLEKYFELVAESRLGTLPAALREFVLEGYLCREHDGMYYLFDVQHSPCYVAGGAVVRTPCVTRDAITRRRWLRYGQPHRVGAPAVVHENGEEWWLDGELHREDGPAHSLVDGSWYWFHRGVLHRIGGPAVKDPNSTQWYENGVLHRKSGPAIVFSDGSCEYYRRGKASMLPRILDKLFFESGR